MRDQAATHPLGRSERKLIRMMSTLPILVSTASDGSAANQKVTEVVADAKRSPGPGLVPELLITSLEASLAFWCRLCGFEVLYDRPDEGFAYITSGTAHIMLEQRGSGRNWIPASLEPETKWYRTGTTEAGVAQFLVQDPDGYLIRFQASLGRRPTETDTL